MPDRETSTFANQLRGARLRAGLSQEALAKRAQLSVNGLSLLERGARTRPHPSTVRLLAGALGLEGAERAAFIALGLGIVPAPGGFEPSRHNLPFPLTSLVGREREIAALVRLLRRDEVRLVTLTGPGGVGKTRLGLGVAHALLDAFDAFPDGIWQVPLARIADPALVVPTIALALGLRESGARSLSAQLRAHLRDRRCLLVLDNFEQVLPAGVGIAEVLSACPGVTALVTSRVALHLSGEHQFGVAPLALPDPAHLPPVEQLNQYAALALFIERAQAVQEDFALTDASASTVAAICARLDGLPLAIELAAVRVRYFSPDLLLRRMSRALPELVDGPRDVEARQRTLRATLAWSYALLNPEEQQLFCRLAVFVGGCTLEAAEAVCAAPDGAIPLAIGMLEGLRGLVAQSLLQQRLENGEPRFTMLYVVREFALERLEASGRAEALRRIHAKYCITLAEQLLGDVRGHDPKPAFERLKSDQDNLRAALAWAVERADALIAVRLAAAMCQLWTVVNQAAESGRWAELVLALPVDPILAQEAERRQSLASSRMRVTFWAAQFALSQNAHERAARLFAEAETMARQLNAKTWSVSCLLSLADIALLQGDNKRAEKLADEAVGEARESGEEGALMEALQGAGMVLFCAREDDRAARCNEELLALATERRKSVYQARATVQLAYIAFCRHDLSRAHTLAFESLRILASNGAYGYAGLDCLLVLAGVASQIGSKRSAARLLGALDTLIALGAIVVRPREQQLLDTIAETARSAMSQDAWAAAYAAGQGLTVHEAYAEALGDDAATGGISISQHVADVPAG